MKQFCWIGMLLFCLMGGQLMAQRTPVPLQAGPPTQQDSTSDSTSKRLEIIHADLLTFDKRDGIGVQKLIGDVQLKQDSTLFFCERAYFYEAENRIEVFDSVRVEMPDSVFLFGDRMEYEGDTRVAEVYDNITLTNQQSVLTTDRLTYYREEDYGYYQDGGKLVDDESILTSEFGYYYPNEDMAYFKKKVELVHPDYTLYTDTLGYNTQTKVAVFLTLTDILSEDGEIQTSSGTYDTQASRVNLTSRSTLKDSSYTLFSDSLDYIDEDNIGIARGNVLVVQEDSTLQIMGQYGRFKRDTDESMVTEDAVAVQFMDEDTLFIFADTLFSTKIYRLIPKSTPDSLSPDSLGLDSLMAGVDSLTSDSLQSDSLLAENIDSTEPPEPIPGMIPGEPFGPPPPRDSVLIGGAMLPDPDQELDSLALLLPDPPLPPGLEIPPSIPDSSFAAIVPDSSEIGPPIAEPTVPMDTLEIRIFKAYQNVRFFMNDMQGRADSMVYFYDDSLIYLFQDPVLWSDENQMSGDTVAVWMKNNQADSMWVGANSFVVSEEDTVGFNQIKGTELRAKFRDNQIDKLHVIGATESIYFVKDDKDTVNVSYQGLNQSQSEEMKMYFEDNEVNKIVFLKQPSGVFKPYYEVLSSPNELAGMRWRITERPERPVIDGLVGPKKKAKPQAEPEETHEHDPHPLEEVGKGEEGAPPVLVPPKSKKRITYSNVSFA